jgi:hypothetical protein
MCQDATARLGLIQRQHGVGGTTKFEGTTLLEILTLEEQLGTDLLIDGAASEDRGAVNGLSDVLECLVNGFKVGALIHSCDPYSASQTKSPTSLVV